MMFKKFVISYPFNPEGESGRYFENIGSTFFDTMLYPLYDAIIDWFEPDKSNPRPYFFFLYDKL
jgi:hypothetical protein